MFHTDGFLKSDLIYIQIDTVAFADVMSSPNNVILNFCSTFVQYIRASLRVLI